MCDLKCPPPWGVIGISGRELLVVCHHFGMSCDHKYYDSEDVIFLICHLNSREQIFKKLYKFMGGSSSRRVTTLPCLVTLGLVPVEIQVIDLSRNCTKTRDWSIKWLDEWELFMLCHHLAMFDGHRYGSSRDMMFLVYGVIKWDQVIKGSNDYSNKSSSM